jgi:hypothetical protein
MKDGELASGSMTTVQRIGETIRRPTGHWTPAVHDLLLYLENQGFTGSPRVLGIDEQNREVLSFLPGEVAFRPWPEVLREDQGIIALTQWLRDYHEVVAGFVPQANARWYVPGVVWQLGQIIRHGDLGSWDSVWQREKLVGFIDWDFAEPGSELEDVAHLTWHIVPLREEAFCREAGFSQMPDIRKRLHLLCATYGTTPELLVEALQRLQIKERERLLESAASEIDPCTNDAMGCEAQHIDEEYRWLKNNLTWLI